MLETNPNWRAPVKPRSDVAVFASEYMDWGGRGNHILPFQVHFLNDAFKRNKDGTWKYKRVAMNAPRQNGKTKVLTAIILYYLYVLGLNVMVTAHEAAAANKILEDVWSSIDANPELRGEVKSHATTMGREQLVLNNGAFVKFRSRKNTGAGMGGTFDLVIFDEAQELKSDYEAMIVKTLKTRRMQLIVYTGTPFLQTSIGDTFNTLIDSAMQDDMVYALRYGIDDEMADIEDEELWSLTNPLYPDVIPRESFLTDVAIAKQGGPNGVMDMRIQDLGLWWADSIPPAIDAGVWESAYSDLPHDRGTLVYALTFDPVNSLLALGVSAMSEESTIGTEHHAKWESIIGEIVDEKPTTDPWNWVADELSSKPRGTTLILDAGGLNNPIREILPKGVNVVQLTGNEFLASQQGFIDLLNEGRFKHTDNVQLTEETRNAQKTKSGDMWKFAPIRQQQTISGLKAVSEAAWYRSVNKPRERHPRTVTV